MNQGLIRRHLKDMAEETLTDTPIAVIDVARQVGENILMDQLLSGRNARAVNLDNLADREAAKRDPDTFVAQCSEVLLAINEVQRVPELMTALKASGDCDRRPGRFLVTGSADLMTLRGSQESLVGRTETILLDGLSQGEIAGKERGLRRIYLGSGWKRYPGAVAIHQRNTNRKQEWRGEDKCFPHHSSGSLDWS